MEEAALPLLDLLLRQLSSAAAQRSLDGDADVAATLAGGLAKLLMQQVLQQEGAPARMEDCDITKVTPADHALSARVLAPEILKWTSLQLEASHLHRNIGWPGLFVRSGCRMLWGCQKWQFGCGSFGSGSLQLQWVLHDRKLSCTGARAAAAAGM